MLQVNVERKSISYEKTKKHIESITALRGISALLVVCEHIVGRPGYDIFNHYFSWLNNLGSYGVASFFVISGFVLPFSLRNNYSADRYGKFLLRRFIRIEPTYIASIIFSSALIFAITRVAQNAEPYSVSSTQILQHLLYLVPFLDGVWIQGVYWTLAVEFQFYLFIGLLYPLMRNLCERQRYNVVLLPLLFSCLVFISPLCEPLQLLKYSPYFALGIFLALHYSYRLANTSLITTLTLLSVPAFMSGISIYAWCSALTTFSLILYWKPTPLKDSWWGKILIFGGTISYSWYVTHQILASLGESAAKLIARQNSFLFQDVVVNTVPVGVFSLSVIVAWILYKLVEQPTHKLSQKISYKANLS